MSLKLTVPAKQTNPNAKIYYVSSESHPNDQPHIVVRFGVQQPGIDIASRHMYFCDCRDFMIRHLPNLGTEVFELCKHCEFCRDSEAKVPAGHELYKAVRETSKFRKQIVPKTSSFHIDLLFIGTGEPMGRSSDLPNNYPTREAAQAAVDALCRTLNRKPYEWYLVVEN